MRRQMTKKTMWVTILLLLVTSTLYGQDIAGNWQGTLKASDMRVIIRISKQLDGSLEARILRVDQNPPDWGSGNRANSVSLEGSDFKFTFNSPKVSYEGKLSASGNSITGAWTQDSSLPLDLHRATKETAWRDPAPHTDQFVAVDKDVRLEVLDWAAPAGRWFFSPAWETPRIYSTGSHLSSPTSFTFTESQGVDLGRRVGRRRVIPRIG